MKNKTIVVLPGDGIGPDIITEAIKVLNKLDQKSTLGLTVCEYPFGGASYDLEGTPLTPETLEHARSADAILLGAVGGEKWANIPRALRPERGLLRLRSELGLFSNLRPALLYPQLVSSSTLKPEVVSGLDIMIVRELTGGIYFGEPRGVEGEIGQRRGFNTLVYEEHEVERIARSAFEVARRRNQRLCSVDKANVLEVSELWREVMTEVGADFSDVELTHMYVDNAAMQLIRAPQQFDVIVTTNMFGDILSDAAAMLTGSIGMLPSASLNEHNQGLYEPIHGSAPDIAGTGKANPLATILSLSMMLRYSLGHPQQADWIERAVEEVLESGLRTEDIFTEGCQLVGTEEMGDAVVEALS